MRNYTRRNKTWEDSQPQKPYNSNQRGEAPGRSLQREIAQTTTPDHQLRNDRYEVSIISYSLRVDRSELHLDLTQGWNSTTAASVCSSASPDPRIFMFYVANILKKLPEFEIHPRNDRHSWIFYSLGTQLLGFRFSGCLKSWISARAGQAPAGVQKSLRLLNAEPVVVLVVNRCCGFETADYTYGDTLVMEKLSEGGRGYLVASWTCLPEDH